MSLSHDALKDYRKKQQKKKLKRTLILTIVIVAVAGLAIGIYIAFNGSGPDTRLVGKPVSSSDYSQLESLATGPYGLSDPSLLSHVTTYTDPSIPSNSPPLVVYIGADYCPYCASQRWPLVIALLRFGSFSNLAYMLSSSTDVYPNTATFSFYGSSYSSGNIAFQPYELQDRSGNALQSLPSAYSGVFQHFSSSFPFIDIANKYVISGALFYPDNMQGKNWTQIFGEIGTSSSLRDQVMSSANVITAALCKTTGGQPSNVCSNSAITNLTPSLTYVLPSASSASFAIGMPSSIPTIWADVQYRQTTWRIRSST